MLRVINKICFKTFTQLADLKENLLFKKKKKKNA